MIYMKIFRFVFFCLIVVAGSIACNNNSNDDKAASIISRSIKISGGNIIQNSIISFQFRDKSYKASRDNGLFVLERRFQDSSKVTTDRLSNEGFKRYVNGQLQIIQDSIAAKYGNSVNSVHYFSVLPYGLQDDAVNHKYIGETTLKGKEYYKIKISFDEVGGGEDFEDVFVYWIEKKSARVDYLAYSFNEDDGAGMRFRKAYNERYIEGIRFVDYENYKPFGKGGELLELDELFEQNKLKLLSKIELKNVQAVVKDN